MTQEGGTQVPPLSIPPQGHEASRGSRMQNDGRENPLSAQALLPQLTSSSLSEAAQRQRPTCLLAWIQGLKTMRRKKKVETGGRVRELKQYVCSKERRNERRKERSKKRKKEQIETSWCPTLLRHYHQQSCLGNNQPTNPALAPATSLPVLSPFCIYPSIPTSILPERLLQQSSHLTYRHGL